MSYWVTVGAFTGKFQVFKVSLHKQTHSKVAEKN